MQKALLIIGALLALGVVFYIGKNLDRWKYMLSGSRHEPTLEEGGSDKFPGVAAEVLVAEALAAERSGNYKEAADRFIAAKRRNLRYRGILFHVAKLAYDHEEFDGADRFFERAIAFGENLDGSNYFRGLIATRRKDLAGARRFFEAAAEAEPFNGDFRYYLAETLRLNHEPTPSMPSYEQAALLARSPLQTTVCRFKIRMARMEAAETSKVAEELEEQEKAGPLPIDWAFTAAALNIRRGDIGEGLRYLAKAKAGGDPGLFASCVTDMYFRSASEIHPLVAEACRLDFNPTATFTPEAKPTP